VRTIGKSQRPFAAERSTGALVCAALSSTQEEKMAVDVKLENVTVNGEWIEGDIIIKVDEVGLNKKEHFRTKKDVEEEIIDLGGGIKVIGKLTLEPPNKVCITGKIKTPFLSFDLPKKCFPVG
jgi:hypothetical protein